MHEPVPVVRDLDVLYTPGDLQSQKERWEILTRRFSELYGSSPQFVARSPGRVNLIGEHIDYSLYEVLPMAIAADVIIAVRKLSAAKVDMANVNPSKFKSISFPLPSSGEVEIDASTHEWTNYFKAGFKGAMELLRKKEPSLPPCGMQILVDGIVPAGGGLSSSAAFVCASALAVLRVNGQEHVIKSELVEQAIVSERSVGVNSGGMDQSASVFSLQGDAVSVSFSPKLHAEAIAFPKTDPPITFMIAQSFVAADKHVTGPECYNLRVVECTLAAEVMAAALGLKLEDDHGPLGRSLRGFQNAYYNGKKPLVDPGISPKEQLETMLSLLTKLLSKIEGYTRQDIASALSISVPKLEETYMTRFPVRTTYFQLHKRAQHVFTEALRVIAFKELLQSAPSADLLPRLGALMNETQDSCRDVYNCSCPELDELCKIAREAGAHGSRLTGAGWGGCTVHLVPKEKVYHVKKAWEDKYYVVKFPEMTKEKLEEVAAVVVSEPGHGSMVSVELFYRSFDR